jgi:lysine 2,3-aminomutase
LVFRYPAVSPAQHYKDVSAEKWASWTWQMQNALTSAEEFQHVFALTGDERRGFEASKQIFRASATPYYASLAISSGMAVDPAHETAALSHLSQQNPIRRILMPTAAETSEGAQQMLDPLDEHNHSPTPRIVHRYSDRVLFLITDTCSVYCRFCTRKRFTASDQGMAHSKQYDEAITYIRSHPGIREVIFSGGDPLTLSNKVLRKVLSDVRAIEHVEIIRIGSRMPVVCPMRVDKELAEMLREFAPVFLMTHFSHPKELTEEAKTAITLIVDHGTPVLNQMVLLNGVNNHPAIIQALSRRLLYLRVKPYYMFQCDPSEGTDHLRTTVESGEALVRELWGHLSGLAMPTFSVDIPSGGGKTTLAPNFMVKNENGVREYVGWDGKRGVYRDPKVPMLTPIDVEEYVPEWERLKSAKD